MKRILATRVMPALVILGGAMVVIGWIADVPAFKSILPVWVTMKFSTAVCFVFAGITLYFIANGKTHAEAAQLVLPVSSLVIMLFMGSFLVSHLLSVPLGIEDLFVRESVNAARAIEPGVPSIVTMVCFLIVVMAGMIALVVPGGRLKIMRFFGLSVASIGITAMLGYATNLPALYYDVRGVSTAMACHTAVLFALWGWGLCASTEN